MHNAENVREAFFLHEYAISFGIPDLLHQLFCSLSTHVSQPYCRDGFTITLQILNFITFHTFFLKYRLIHFIF
jgi:hypothetical protein